MGFWDFFNKRQSEVRMQTVRLSMSDIDKYRWVMGDSLYQKYSAANLVNNQEYFNVGIGLLSKWKEKYAKEEAENALNRQMGEKSRLAMQFEKSGDIDKAMILYQELVDAKYDWLEVYKRLIILYRKKKMYDEEMVTIKSAISRFGRKRGYEKEKEKLFDRMVKVKDLQIKRDQKTK